MPTTRHLTRLLASTATTAAIGLVAAGSSSADLTTQIQAGKSTAQSLQSQINSQTTQIESTANGVAQARAKLEIEQAALEQHIVALRNVQTQVMTARQQLLHLERTLQAASSDLAANLRAAYENGSPNLVDVILSSNGFNNLLNQVSYLKDAQKQDAREVTITVTDRKEVLKEATNLGQVELRDQTLTNDIVVQRNQIAATESALVQQQIDEQSARSNTRSKLANVQAHTAALQKKLDAIEAAAEAAARQTPTQVNEQVGGLAIDTGGMVQAPAGAPAAVAQMIAAGNAIATLPYIWGGGHGSFISPGYDCSGSVSYVLAAAGMLNAPETSGELESYGDPGPGKWVTIYADAGHVWMQIGNWRFDTVALSEDGTRWASSGGEYAGFVVRHPVGL
jgi:peptidoglycan hydrolase CwlO-like protein